jgi:hypothetical protein
MGTAKRVKSTLKEFKGEAHLYKVDPPASYYTGHTEPEHTTEYVVVSAVNAPCSGAETFIFPADEEGNVLDWAELEGSCRGDYTHEHALEEAGYKLIE